MSFTVQPIPPFAKTLNSHPQPVLINLESILLVIPQSEKSTFEGFLSLLFYSNEYSNDALMATWNTLMLSPYSESIKGGLTFEHTEKFQTLLYRLLSAINSTLNYHEPFHCKFETMSKTLSLIDSLNINEDLSIILESFSRSFSHIIEGTKFVWPNSNRSVHLESHEPQNKECLPFKTLTDTMQMSSYHAQAGFRYFLKNFQGLCPAAMIGLWNQLTTTRFFKEKLVPHVHHFSEDLTRLLGHLIAAVEKTIDQPFPYSCRFGALLSMISLFRMVPENLNNIAALESLGRLIPLVLKNSTIQFSNNALHENILQSVDPLGDYPFKKQTVRLEDLFANIHRSTFVYRYVFIFFLENQARMKDQVVVLFWKAFLSPAQEKVLLTLISQLRPLSMSLHSRLQSFDTNPPDPSIMSQTHSLFKQLDNEISTIQAVSMPSAQTSQVTRIQSSERLNPENLRVQAMLNRATRGLNVMSLKTASHKETL